MPPKVYSVFFYHCCKNHKKNKHLVILTNHKVLPTQQVNNQDKIMKKPKLIIITCLRDTTFIK